MKNLKIAIASGKGGTGKTTVAVNLHDALQPYLPAPILLVDCDVEAPNDLLFYPEATCMHQSDVERLVPHIHTDRCTFCRKCSEYCAFNALVVIPPAGFAEVNHELCHSCGACKVACDFNAIEELPEKIGEIALYRDPANRQVMEGRLKIGSAMQTMVIKELKKKARQSSSLLLFDSPPGTSCPVVTTLSDADYVVLVTEPTPFGLYDLQLTVEMTRNMGKNFGVVINKAGLGNREVYDYLEHEKIEQLGEIPFDPAYAANYACGNLRKDIPPQITRCYGEIAERLVRKIHGLQPQSPAPVDPHSSNETENNTHPS